MTGHNELKSANYISCCMMINVAINLFILGDVAVILKCLIFKHILVTDISSNLLWNCPQVTATEHDWWKVNIGSAYDLVPSGNKPSPDPILTITRPQWVKIWQSPLFFTQCFCLDIPLRRVTSCVQKCCSIVRYCESYGWHSPGLGSHPTCPPGIQNTKINPLRPQQKWHPFSKQPF